MRRRRSSRVMGPNISPIFRSVWEASAKSWASRGATGGLVRVFMGFLSPAPSRGDWDRIRMNIRVLNSRSEGALGEEKEVDDRPKETAATGAVVASGRSHLAGRGSRSRAPRRGGVQHDPGGRAG